MKKQVGKMGCYLKADQLFVYRWAYPGAVKMATIWLIPKDAEKPADRRFKNTKK